MAQQRPFLGQSDLLRQVRSVRPRVPAFPQPPCSDPGPQFQGLDDGRGGVDGSARGKKKAQNHSSGKEERSQYRGHGGKGGRGVVALDYLHYPPMAGSSSEVYFGLAGGYLRPVGPGGGVVMS